MATFHHNVFSGAGLLAAVPGRPQGDQGKPLDRFFEQFVAN